MQKKFGLIGAGAVVVAAAAFGYHKLAGAQRAGRDAVIGSLVQQVMLPGYQAFRNDAAELTLAADKFCQAPSAAGREQLEAAWVKARTSWKRTEAYQIGPAVDERLAAQIDFWPLRPWVIEGELKKDAPIDQAYVTALPAPGRGLPVLELLVYGPAGEALAAKGERDRSCDLIIGVAKDIESSADQLLGGWLGDKGASGYAAKLSRTQGDTTFATPQAALDVLVNQIVLTVFTIEDMKIARPLGKRHGNMIQPEALESAVSKRSVEDILANLEGVRQLYVGADGGKGPGLDELVGEVKPELNQKVLDAITQLETALKAVKPDLGAVAESGAPEGEAAFRAAVQVTKLFQTEVIQALGVTLTFSANDGD